MKTIIFWNLFSLYSYAKPCLKTYLGGGTEKPLNFSECSERKWLSTSAIGIWPYETHM